VKIRKMLTEVYRRTPDRNLLVGVLLAFLPAAVIGLLFGKAIKAYLFAPVPRRRMIGAVMLLITIIGYPV